MVALSLQSQLDSTQRNNGVCSFNINMESERAEYVIVNNIPKIYHSEDLRNFFSAFVETRGFLCFHFRHRPEIQRKSEQLGKPDVTNGTETENLPSRCVTACCVVKMDPTRTGEFVELYNGKHWIDKKGDTLLTRCFIMKIKIVDTVEDKSSKVTRDWKRGTVSSNLPIDRETFLKKDLDALIEMHPPSLMPNGNVGTTTLHFLKEIQSCRLPPSLISKLGLRFPRTRSRRIYGSVPFEYCRKKRLAEKGRGKSREDIPLLLKSWSQSEKDDTYEVPTDEENDEESEEEEWDRHEAFHDDVTGQERLKERLFEGEIELKWEKGGSGLVFYTDAQFWDAKDGDFDAKTSDDWDIDTSIYSQPAVSADKDARDMMQMRLEEHLRNEPESLDPRHSFASFEKYTKGFGRKVLESQGWKQGQGIGKRALGIAEPLSGDGQLPYDKKGFGYRGEKLKRQPIGPQRRKRRFSNEDKSEFFISTIYDNPQTTRAPESVLTSSFFSRLKYQKEFTKEHSGDFN